MWDLSDYSGEPRSACLPNYSLSPSPFPHRAAAALLQRAGTHRISALQLFTLYTKEPLEKKRKEKKRKEKKRKEKERR